MTESDYASLAIEACLSLIVEPARPRTTRLAVRECWMDAVVAKVPSKSGRRFLCSF